MANIQQEIWKPILGYVGFYEVSNFGNVKSLERKAKRKNNSFFIEKEKVLKINTSNRYGAVKLCKLGNVVRYSVHRLVATAFLPNAENKSQVNHIDGNKLNNHVDNLEWNTHQENSTHAWVTGLYTKESISKMNEIVSVCILDMETGIFYNCMRSASLSLNKNKNYISCHKKKVSQKYPMSRYISNRFVIV